MYLEEKANTLKAELEYVVGLHRENPTNLKDSYQQGKDYSERAFKIAEMLEKKEKEIEMFTFFHPEYTEVFA